MVKTDQHYLRVSANRNHKIAASPIQICGIFEVIGFGITN